MANLIKVVCLECGKEEYVSPSRAKHYKCCCKKCISQYTSRTHSKHIHMICPICGKEYGCKPSATHHHRTCGNQHCRHEWLSISRTGKGNVRYKSLETAMKEQSVAGQMTHDKSRNIYYHIVKVYLKLNSCQDIPKGYVVHHKDANHSNNNPENLVLLPKSAHRLIHTWFGNILINALHTNKIDRDTFFKCCNDEQATFYKEIIDLNITHQVVVKQGELLENPEVDNQQPSIYRNIIEGSTTNSRILPDNAEDSNANTSALPIDFNGDDIV